MILLLDESKAIKIDRRIIVVSDPHHQSMIFQVEVEEHALTIYLPPSHTLLTNPFSDKDYNSESILELL